jgi:Fe-S cluster biogenesis protein NfuA
VTGAGEFRQRLGRIESLVMALEDLPDTASREAARGLVRALLDLHKVGLRRMLELCGDDAAGRFADDALAGSLMLLHELHPFSAAERLNRALERMRPRFQTFGGDVELLHATEEIVQLRLRGDPTASPALRAAAEELVVDHVPDVTTVEFEESWEAARVSLPLFNRGT